MARFDTSGIDDIIDQLVRMGEGTGEIADSMLMAGAEEVKKAWKQAAKSHKLKDTGDMINSIGYANSPKTANEIRMIDIYPQGKDRKGVRNAEKAFILHYGASSRVARKRSENKKYPGQGIPATHWVDDADKLAEPEVERVFTEIFDKFVNK